MDILAWRKKEKGQGVINKQRHQILRPEGSNDEEKLVTKRKKMSLSLLQRQNESSFIMTKSSSNNVSNENKQMCFCCLQDKTWIKMPILWNYWDSLTNFLM